MSRPPSPISPAASTVFTYHHNNSAFTPIDGNSHEESYRVTFDVKPESQRRLDYTYGSLEDEAGTPKLDPGELQHEVAELCHTNKRLHGENAELTTYLTQAEDANCSLRQHCIVLEQDLSSIKTQLADARRLEAELEEVRTRLEAERDENGELCDRLTHLERDNCTLQERIHELSAQVRHAQEEVESLTQKEECLIQEHQMKVAKLAEDLSIMREQSVLQDKTSHQLNTTILEMKKVTKVLEDEKNGLEEQLDIVRGELEMATSMHCSHMQKEIQNITEEDEVISDPKLTPYHIVFGSGGAGGSVSSKRRLPWVPHLYSTPYPSRISFINSDIQTPSIHSEMQALGENNGSLPFCEKSESGSSFQSPFKNNMASPQVPSMNGDIGRMSNINSGSVRDTNELQANLVSMFSRYLSWWKKWEAKGVPLIQGLHDVNVRPLQEHLTAHHGELLKLESELQHVLKSRGISYSRMINEQRRFSESSAHASDVSSQETQATQKLRSSLVITTPRRRAPCISRVKNMVSRFEVIANKELEASRSKEAGGRLSQSLPCTPVMPRWNTSEERPASVENKREVDFIKLDAFLPLTKENQRQNSSTQSIYDEQRLEFVSPDSRPIQDRDINSNFKQSPEELAKVRLNEDGDTSVSGVVLMDSIRTIDVNDIPNCQSSRSPSDRNETINEVTSLSSKEFRIPLVYGLDGDDDSNSNKRDDVSAGVYQYKIVTVVEEEPTSTEEEDRSLVEVCMEIENSEDVSESDLYNNSHLMKLMREVTEQREQITQLREQDDFSEKSRKKINTRLIMIFIKIQKWTEAVRKEWLTTADAQGDDGDEKQDLSKEDFSTKELSKSPQQQTNHRKHEQKQQDNDEIELLIRTRCESGCVDSQDDLDKDLYLSPETVAVELERELLALKLHVARSHALLHQYQSSSLHGSRSEVSTPTNTLHKTGVGGDLGGGELDGSSPGLPFPPKNNLPHICAWSSRAQLPKQDRCSAAGSGATTATPGSDEGPGSAAAAGGGGGGGTDGAALLLQESPHAAHTFTLASPQRGLEQMCESVVKEAPIAEQEEEDEEEGEEETISVSSSVEMSALTSDHALYCPKPNYEQLDQYSGSTMVSLSRGSAMASPSSSPTASLRRSPDDQKQRRTGLTVIPNQDGLGKVSSDSDEAAESDLEESTNDKTALLARRRPPRLQHTRSPVSSGATASSENEVAAGGSTSSSGTPSVDEIDTFDESALQKPRRLRALQRGASSLGPISIGSAINTSSSPADVDTFSSYPYSSNNSVVDATACSNTTEEQPLSLTNASESVENLQENNNNNGNSNEGFQRGRSVSVFPSLQDNYLRALGLSSDINGVNENLSEKEIENKFSQLSLAFKTDKLTLRQRLDVQRRHRDTAENNMEAEVTFLKKTINGLHVEYMDSDLTDNVSTVSRCLDVLATAAEGLVSASEDKLLPIYAVQNSNNEVWGAVQQEWRVSLALEVFLLHVENVKRMYEKDHQELEETKRLLTEYQIPHPKSTSTGNSGNQSPGVSDAPAASRRIRALSLAGSPRGQSGSNSDVSDRPPRRVSLGAFLKGGASGRRASLMPDLGLFRLVNPLMVVRHMESSIREEHI
ncbi:unnamed protein product, partial [Meganyctiphanes norvegica]